MSVETPLHIVTADPHMLALSIRASCLVFEDPASTALLEHVRRIAPAMRRPSSSEKPAPARS